MVWVEAHRADTGREAEAMLLIEKLAVAMVAVRVCRGVAIRQAPHGGKRKTRRLGRSPVQGKLTLVELLRFLYCVQLAVRGRSPTAPWVGV